MKSRKLESCTTQALLLLLLFSAAAYALDAPHRNGPGYDITCGNCHWTSSSSNAPWSSVNYPDAADNTLNNRRCALCHDGGVHNGNVLPLQKTHSATSTSSGFWATFGGWRAECINCHYPHAQRQTWWWGTASHLVTGPPAVIGAWNTSSNLTQVTLWSTLTGEYQGYYFMPDRTRQFYYKIKSSTLNTNVIHVMGLVQAQYIGGGGLAIVYGKNIVEYMQYSKPDGRVEKDVRLFRPTGLNNLADGDNVRDGICEVCHTAARYYRNDGSGTAHNAGGDCLLCHGHSTGFRPQCGNCHGGPPVTDAPAAPGGLVWTTPTGSTTAGAHNTHANLKAIACEACHFSSVATGTTHNSGSITIGFYSLGGATQGGAYDGQSGVSYNWTSTAPATTASAGGSKVCSNVYCHGATMIPNGGTDTTPVWDVPSTAACGTCHGATAANPPLRGSHGKHARAYLNGYNYACGLCHKDPSADSSLHVNKGSEVIFSSDARTAGGDYSGSDTMSDAYGACTNIYCHSSVQSSPPGAPPLYRTTPAWGSNNTLGCSSCHDYYPGLISGSHQKHLLYPDNQECYTCHNWNNSDDSCMACHDEDSIKPQLDRHANHSIDVAFAPGYGGSYGGTPAPGDGYGSCSNTYCHSNGTGGTSNPGDARGVAANMSPSWGSSVSCGSCHGNPPGYSAGAPKANSHASHASWTCDRCHYATTTDGVSITNYSNHVNRTYDLQAGSGTSFSYSYATTGGSCSNISCHGNINTQWGASLECLDCHAISQGNRAAISPQFSGNSHHVQGSAVTSAHCYRCHWEATEDGKPDHTHHQGPASPGAAVDLVIYGAGTRPLAYSTGTTAVQYTANGSRAEIVKINSHCLGCHDDDSKDAVPFADGKTPRQYAWDSTSVAARYSQWGTTNWGKYASFAGAAKKDITKAYSAHGNARDNYGGGWSSTPNGTGNDGTLVPTRGGATAVSVACFDCHNSHGSTVAGKTTSYAGWTTNGGILKDTTTGKGGYGVTYQPKAGGSEANKNAYNPGGALCFDCHLSASWGTTPWGYNSTYGASQPVLGYLDTPYFGPGTFPSKQRFPYKSTGHKGGHLGAWATLSVAPTGSIGGLCTPCHDPHGVSPTLSSNAQYAVPLLKGTFMTSPYKEDAAPSTNGIQTIFGVNAGNAYHIDQNTFGTHVMDSAATGVTQDDTQFAGLCLKCHPKNSLTDGVDGGTWKGVDRIHESVKGWGANTKHRYICSKCHATHNSLLPRLMVSNCLNTRHKGRAGYVDNPVLSGSGHECGMEYIGDERGCGGGSGGFPGSYNADDIGAYTVACHENQSADQTWNVRTPWGISPTITSGPSAGSFDAAGNNVRAVITWSTDLLSNSCVDYGPTSGYGSTTCGPTNVTAHSVTLQNLANHITYHYRVRSANSNGDTPSGDNTFYVSVPPGVPALTNPADAICSSNCSAALQFFSTDPDAGTIQYFVEIDTNDPPVSGSPNYQSRTWDVQSAWSPSLVTNKRWYWRAKARDAGHTTPQDPASAWSSVYSFAISDGLPPSQVTLAAPASGSAVLSDFALVWNTAAGALTEYQVQYSTDPAFLAGVVSSAWIPGTAFYPYPGPGSYYWRVKARNSVSLAEAPWSSSPYWSFTISDGCYGDSCCLYGCSTCPTLYSWDGSTYAFETDTFPTGFLGTKTATGWRKPNPYEYHLLENPPQPLDGYYSLKIVEERDEQDYFDTLKLYAVDYPQDRDIYQELRTAGVYVEPSQMIHTVDKTLQRPVSISHINTEENVSSRLANSDGDYLVLNTDRNIDFNWQTLEIDLGDQSSAPQVKLIIDAEMVVPTTSAGMARKTLLSPNGKITRLEIPDAGGNWTLVPYAVKEVFSPKERSNAYIVDITNIFTTGIYKFRLSFLYKVYVDAIFFDTTADIPVSLTELPLVSATLGYYGFSEKTEGEIFDYIYGSIVSRDTSYFSGNYTKYGDVTPLLTQTDDKFVIFSGGEEIDVRFNADGQPPAGKSRRYLVYANGYYKATGNMDIPHTVGPLPFRAMSNYPYDPAVEHYPDDADHNQYQLEYNTRLY